MYQYLHKSIQQNVNGNDEKKMLVPKKDPTEKKAVDFCVFCFFISWDLFKDQLSSTKHFKIEKTAKKPNIGSKN